LFPAGKVVTGVSIRNPFAEKDYAEGKLSVHDVKARDDPGRLFLVEMQQFLPGAFAKRLLSYWARGHSEQVSEGERYELLQPTYLICFVNERAIDDEHYHHRFRVQDEQTGVVLCKDLEIHLIELSKFTLSADQVKTPLERWAYFFKHGALLDLDNLPATLDVPAIRQAVEVLMRLSQDELERERYEERRRAQRDAADLRETARLALQEARTAQQKGREQGQLEGQLVGRIRLLQQLLQQPETASEELFRLDEGELLRLEESLKRQLGEKKDANGTPPADGT
jgi:predicted transposase/invertase (TIGR01784 family)